MSAKASTTNHPPLDVLTNPPTLDEEKKDKGLVEQIERVVPEAELQQWADRDEADIEKQPGIFGFLFKKNPSPAFIADLAKMNETELDPKEVRRLTRKIDLLILPALSICYMFYYIDKTTLSYAAIFDLKSALHLGTSEYSWLSSLFYFGWLAWALPTNMMMQKFPLNKYLAVNIFMWGVLLMCQAASRNFTDLAVLRTLSGAAEATADPAFVLITSTWYTRAQQPSRIGVWYCANGLGIALGGLLGYAIGHINAGLQSWQYEFVIVGTLCTSWAIILWIFVPDSPYMTHWFKRHERLMIVSRKRDDQHSPDRRQWNASQVLEAFIDPKIYLFFLFGFTANIPNGGTSNFGTLIVKGFGFNTFQTTLMQIPYGMIIVAFIVAAIVANRYMPPNTRTILMVMTNIPTVVGFAMVAWCKSSGARLAGYWLTGASNATFVVGLSLVSGNVGGQTKKALASASVFLGVAAGNIVGPFLFKDSEAPVYLTGIVGCLISRALEIVIIIILRFIFITSNKRRDRAVAEGRVVYDERITALEDISDWRNPAFRYVA